MSLFSTAFAHSAERARAQYDVLQNTELLEDRSSLMLLAAVLPPSVVYRRAILIDLGTRDFATGMASRAGWVVLPQVDAADAGR